MFASCVSRMTKSFVDLPPAGGGSFNHKRPRVQLVMGQLKHLYRCI